jgi:hypothetical protein
MEVEMKMVKSLLLGGAAGLLAVAGAQAADMPVKAKAVAYVKICTLYGDGFYYIPGTDTCLKISGYVRNQHYFAHGSFESSATNGPFFGNGTNMLTGNQTDYIIRSRTSMYFDARTQTEYGTLRSVLSVGFSFDSPGNSGTAAGGINPYANRAFIQIAGFTFGQAQSFYDFFSGAAVSYFGLVGQSDTGDGGWKVAAYTAQFGNGVSATLSFEDARRLNSAAASTGAFANGQIAGAYSQVSAGNVGAGAGGATVANQSYVTERMPDILGVLRVDQAWGAAQVMAAVTDASGGYYDFNFSCNGAIGAQAAGTSNCGHPSQKLGFAVGGGLRINAPWFGQGDYFQTQVTYTNGALKYASNTPLGGAQAAGLSSYNVALGIGMDGTYGKIAGVPTSNELTTAWSAAASFEHNWSPRWKTSIYGTYLAVSFNDNARTLICNNIASAATAGVAGTVSTVAAGTALNCSPNWQVWEVGSRTQWNVTRGLYMGVDVLYRKLETGFVNSVFFYNSNTTRPSGLYAAKDQDAIVTTFRIHRDFPY